MALQEKDMKQDFIRQQQQLQERIDLENRIRLEELRLVAGVDLAYWKSPAGKEKKKGDQEDFNGKTGNTEYAVCCIVVLDFATRQIVERQYYIDQVSVPYIPGCLAFRELPLFFQTKERLESSPDLYVFDGNGYLHPRNMGIATHAGILMDKPSIGVAKTYYKVEDTDFVMPKEEVFAYEDIVIAGRIYGRAVRTQKQVRPIFLSVGNQVDLDTAMEVVRHLVTKESHIPLPTRLADLMTHEVRKKWIEQQY